MRQLIGSGYQICQADDTLMSTPRIEWSTGASTSSVVMTDIATFSVPDDYHATQQSTLMIVISWTSQTSPYSAMVRAYNGMAYPTTYGCVTWSTGVACIVVPCVGGDTISIQGSTNNPAGTMRLNYYNVYALDVHAKTDASPEGISWE